MIPLKAKTGPKQTRYGWETMKRGEFITGGSRESLIGGFKNYFHVRKGIKARFTTRKQPDGTYRIYRLR